MASVAPIMPKVTETPLLSLARDVQSYLSQAEAVLTLAIHEIEGCSPGINALGAVRGLIVLSSNQAEEMETLMMRQAAQGGSR